MSTEAGRNELFGNAPNRVQEQQRAGYGQPPPGQQAPGQQSGAYGDAAGGVPGGYGNYNDRELTAEEQEEEEVGATKQEIRFMKQQDVSSTRNALRLAQQAEESGRDTLARLGAQGERIHNTERNLDLSSSQNRIAEEKARELKTLNRSMFAVHVSNPFTSTSRREDRDRKMMETHRTEREQRDAVCHPFPLQKTQLIYSRPAKQHGSPALEDRQPPKASKLWALVVTRRTRSRIERSIVSTFLCNFTV
jgi:hypothetical protein